MARIRRQPKFPRRATLAGSPSLPPAPKPKAEPVEAVEAVEDKPKKRAARKRAPKPEVEDE